METVNQRKLRYFGHIVRKLGRLEKDIVEGTLTRYPKHVVDLDGQCHMITDRIITAGHYQSSK